MVLFLFLLLLFPPAFSSEETVKLRSGEVKTTVRLTDDAHVCLQRSKDHHDMFLDRHLD